MPYQDFVVKELKNENGEIESILVQFNYADFARLDFTDLVILFGIIKDM